MLQRIKTDTLNWIFVIVIVLFLLEIFLFNGWLIFSMLFSGFFMFLGWKNFTQTWGKVFFFIGSISLFFNIINTMAVRFLIIAAVILFIRHYQRAKKEPDHLTPSFEQDDEAEIVVNQEPMIQTKPLLNNRLFGDQSTEQTAYKWNDISIHGAFGDRIIDLTNTVLPNQAVVSIRHLIGNIVIYVPYEVEIMITHSSVFGRANILDEHHEKLLNETLSYHTVNYHNHEPKVKIVTSIFSGDIEVRRI
ncbi:cell wall-active antibiotics response protein LiaF [Salinibacillus xinjiangensis]|uniref:Cell wall-active antibiotics response LiaF-like C-terminal domain-containing protein n=1 Tax=Salinibacillus xinjiangensis TaxID=1229268 RepID=A0A6G1X8T5_9BACI|nr:cell wall-active antibiotics response protein LiaF [Salinibacillus xinjiangensis]MRG87315.1 hypothetical protein [Salinibacillus xinjiangensis]